MVVFELENCEIDQEELIGRLCETKHDICDLMDTLGAVEFRATELGNHS